MEGRIGEREGREGKYSIEGSEVYKGGDGIVQDRDGWGGKYMRGGGGGKQIVRGREEKGKKCTRKGRNRREVCEGGKGGEGKI